jgi:amidase
VVAGPAPRHGELPGAPPPSGDEYRAFDYVHLLALAGLPAASVPAGSEDGLPIGVQVAAGPFCEHVLLAAAAALEARVDPAML